MKSKNKSLFVASLKLATKNPNKVGLMILFDIMFFVSFFGLRTLFSYFAKSLVVEKTLLFGLIFLVFTLIYYLIVLFVYSLFKYSILYFIKSFFERAEISFKSLGQFYSLNIIIAGIFFAIFLIFGFILENIKQAYQPFVFISLAVPYSLFLYVILNTSHSLFYEGASTKESIKKSFKITFTKIKVYRETILVMILFAVLLGILFKGAGYLINLIAPKNYFNVYYYFKLVSIVVFDIVFYFIILINRISFYQMVKNFNASH